MRRAGAAVSISVFAFFLLLAGGVASETTTSTDGDRKTDIRLVTLSPHLAELVHAVGAGNMLVGVSAYSNFPASLTALPQIGDAFLIDQEQLLLLRPDMLLAWQSGTPAHAVRDLRNRGYRVETIQTRSLEDIASALKTIGELIGHENQAVSVAAQFARDLQELRVMHAQDDPIRVFYQISQRPLYTANSKHYISEIIEICGGENIFADLGELAPMVSEEAVIVRDPEVMIAGGIDAEDVAFAEWQRWPAMAANAQGNHFYIPADLLARPTPRLVQAATMICNVLDTARENRVQASDQ
jgi:iron complex transport system substrate-binding protein